MAALAGQSRPEPMNASPHHSKVKVSLELSDPLFVAGQYVSGKMQIECRTDKGLGMGVIMVELFAIQELTSRDHSATSTFLHLTRRFQGPGLPPSNAVDPYPTPGAPPLIAHQFPARKGQTTFFFRFPLPATSPSSIDFGKGLARLRYEVRASVEVGWKGERKLVTDKLDVDVVEAYADDEHESGEKVIIGENGKMWVQGRVVDRFLVAGQPACVELHVKNHSAKKTTSLSLNLSRHLRLSSGSNTSNPPRSLEISDSLASTSFKGPEYIVQPGTEGIANLVFDVPRNARGLRGGLRDGGDADEFDESAQKTVDSLFSVQCVIGITLGMPIGSKDIHLQLPVTIVHPSSLPEGPPVDYYPMLGYPNVNGAHDAPIMPLPPQPHYALAAMQPPSPQFQPYMSPHPGGYLSHPGSPVQSPYGYQVSSPVYQHPHEHPWPPWSPPPQLGYLSQPASHGHTPEQQYYYPPPPAAYASPPRPISADPFIAQQLPNLPPQSIEQPPPIISERPNPSETPTKNAAEESPAADGIEGKGLRASRITAHLRHTSRHRSVSPTSHRFPFPAHTSPTNPISIPTGLPPSPQHNQTFLSVSPALSAQSNCEVVSPRPMLSPKHSFTQDPTLAAGTLARSERVEELERIAAEEAEKEDARKRESQNDKTLPAPPVPSGKVPPPSTTTPRVEDVFSIPRDEGTPKMPPQPTLTPMVAPRYPKSEHLGALDLLEQKLLEQVGTRKPDSGAGRKADVRSLMPITIPPLDRLDSSQTQDSAISSLALADVPSADSRERADPGIIGDSPGKEKNLKKSASNEKATAGDKVAAKREKGQVIQKRERKHSDTHQLKEAATGRVAAWLGGIDPTIPPPSANLSLGSSPKSPPRDVLTVDDSPEHSPHPLLRPAPDPKPWSPEGVKRETVYATMKKPPLRSSGFVLHPTVKGNPPFDTPPEDLPNSERSHNAAPLAGSPPSEKPAAVKVKSLYPPRPSDPEVSYDIRSARGGRGGKVSSVAAMWASVAQQQESNPVKSKPPVAKKPAALDLNHLKPAGLQVKPPMGSDGASQTRVDAKARRAKAVKSTSVPAVVSSSLATPMLSSTASLARPPQPPGLSKSPLRLPATISEAQSDPTSIRPPPVKGEMVFGQAKLKDLIRKYQQGG
ncbi:hypothetical protein BD410DRAFT_801167 [Rickenella mellea]|uniref:Arrestin-like N-terminal domain-containing protein n=1 Tax=Rickenella mellea TaxID=50990 RepID=A0A4Y7QF07_9AGAM|nr:hypothetical protein BD410DRAFT_801167 [Rickenella mellea]